MKHMIAILGAGESGVGAALLAYQKGYAVWVSDAGKISDSRKTTLKEWGIEFEEGVHSENLILAADEIIKSPGIPPTAPIVKKALKKGIPVIDELEFASRYSKGKVIAITGTNGKTTTTLLTYHLMKKAGLDVGMAGNVGESWAGQLVNEDHAWWVLEVSSFQIDGFKSLKPKIAVLTNITPDHLDRYAYNLDNYIASKISLFKNMNEEDAAIYFADDLNIQVGLGNINLQATTFPVMLTKQIERGGYFNGEEIQLCIFDQKIKIKPSEIALKGKHNMLNTMFATLVATLAGVKEDMIREALLDFKNVAHRMENVANINGVSFVNDSKGTNVDATAYALDSYSDPLIWIAGGVDKGNDYEVLLPIVRYKVKILICLGKNNEKLRKAFEGAIPVIKETQSVDEAVSWGLDMGEAGDVVLLSPACASFDLFKNYEDRGNQFKSAVAALKSTVL
ncbi:UDP-N-acetylmuramoyl-L-alanine--D-glutamate ligase [Aquiflexum lacus]|uniref:UDP-N-acetylmuramoyl-L-alanine--D-glutamate ligase n=1 Tax=Aquiflexum lacus TaxID=2483805 RepID=UPI001894F873|nr:UDP-N-acetylmuramoyl-L-alanine--D-glutamate ligase [Aquiflexum lacus]